MQFTGSRLAAFALAALAFASSSVTTAVDRVATCCRAAYRFACDFVASVPAKFTEPALPLVARPVELVQACAYAVGLAKRQRPRVTPGWRMCPST
ncbi:hypothetical protein D9M72_522620 [compost metagenome]